MKKLGIIGGLGPMATAYFLQLLTQMTAADTDQEHMEIFIYNKPSIPDRTKYILGKGTDNPVPELMEAGKMLMRCGAEVLALPCITAHYFLDELVKKGGLPIIDAVEETVHCLKEKGIARVGILGTDGTVQSRLFQKALERGGIRGIVPGADGQKRIMEIIYNEIKAGKEVDVLSFEQVAAELSSQGAQMILIACTELSLIKRDYELTPRYLDVLEVLAIKAVESCGMLKKQYKEEENEGKI